MGPSRIKEAGEKKNLVDRKRVPARKIEGLYNAKETKIAREVGTRSA
jgi:hypothetical protein